MRLIDADALTIDLFKKSLDEALLHGNADMHRLLIQVVAHYPTVDAEPVTRCAECVWYVTRQMKYDGTLDKRYKPTWCELWRAEMKGNDYCSRGERK